MSGTGSSKYIPNNVIDFCIWTRKTMGYAAANCERWGVSPPPESIITDLEDLEILAEKCKEPTHSSVDIHDRNALRKKVERDVRNYLQGMVMRNIAVTTRDRELMALPLRDTVPTPVGDPVGLVTAMVKYPQEGALELNIVHIEGTEFDKRANYGVKIAYDIFPIDASMPDDILDLRRSVFTRRKRHLFTFDRKDSHRLAIFCLCYENSKGRAGRWGPMIQAVIP